MVSRLGDSVERPAYRGQVALSCSSEKQATRQPPEELHSNAHLKAFDLLADRPRRHSEFVGCALETLMTGGGFEGTQTIEGGSL